MQLNLLVRVGWFAAWILSFTPLFAELIVYPFPAELQPSQVYQVFASDTQIPTIQTKRGTILSFGMTRAIDLRVQLTKPPKEVVVRPLSAGLVAKIEGNGFQIQLPRPMNLSVEMDGDLENPLLVFANPKIQEPARDDPKVKFYEGGKIHDVGEIFLNDDETLYLAAGAVVRGVVRAIGAKNVSVKGPGILDGGSRSHKINMLVLRECRDALLENFILLDPLGWSMHLSGSQQVRISNTKVVGWRANSDGLDIEYSKDVTVEGCFWRSNDDCIAIKAIYPPAVTGLPLEEMIHPEFIGGHTVEPVPGASMGNINIQRCVLWNDSGGQGFEVGFELRIDEIRGITFCDSDIIHVVGGGAFTIHNGDHARIKDLRIENIRVEDTDRFVDFHVGMSIYSVDCPREYQRSNPKRVAVPANHRPKFANNPYQWFVPESKDLAQYDPFRGMVDGVVFKNIQLLKEPKTESMMNGFSEQRAISNIRFEDVVIAGKAVRSAADAGIRVNEYVRDLEFSSSKGEP